MGIKRDTNFVTAMGAENDSSAVVETVLKDNATGGVYVHIVGNDVSAGDGAILDGASASIKATVLDYTNSNPLAVRLTDTSGDYVGAGAGTQYSDGDANADPTGTVAMGTDGSNIFALHTDTSGDLQVDILTTPSTITGIAHGVTTVTTAGTDVALAGSTACKRVVIQAQTDNTGLIAVGATGVDATEATGNGVILYAGDSFELDIDNLADVYIDSTVNGEGVRYSYFT